MPVDQKLLDILCCPKTKIDVQYLSNEDLKQLNEKISQGKIKFVDGNIVKDPLSEGLVTIDKKTIYQIDEDIPIMLIEKGIAYSQIL
jgi:uncharacterized protein YbaR (Trm112 family)